MHIFKLTKIFIIFGVIFLNLYVYSENFYKIIDNNSKYFMLAPETEVNDIALPFLSKNQKVNSLVSKIIKRFHIDVSAEAYDHFQDISVDGKNLTVALLPIMKQLLLEEPDTVLTLSNGGDPIGGELYDMLKEFQSFTNNTIPQFTNIIFPRKLVISEILWTLLTKNERESTLSPEFQLQLSRQIDMTIADIQDNIVDPDKQILESLLQIKTNLFQTFGEIIIKMSSLFPDRRDHSFQTKTYFQNYFLKILPFLKKFMSQTEVAIFFQGKSICILDEITYTGDALVKANAIVQIMNPRNFYFSLVVDYNESSNEYKNDPIGEKGLNSLGIRNVIYGRKGRQSSWSLVNVDVGPSYLPHVGDDIPLLIKNIKDGYALRYSSFGQIIFDAFLQYISVNPFNTISKSDIIFVDKIDKSILKDLFIYSLKDAFNQTKISRKYPIPWKEKEFISDLQVKLKDETDFLISKMIKIVLLFLKDLLTQLEYFREIFPKMTESRYVFANVLAFKEYLNNIKIGEKIIFHDSYFRELTEIYLKSDNVQDLLPLFMQLAVYQILSNNSLKDIDKMASASKETKVSS